MDNEIKKSTIDEQVTKEENSETSTVQFRDAIKIKQTEQLRNAIIIKE